MAPKSYPFSIFCFLFLMFPALLLAQSQPKRLLGTFIYKSKVYNYEFISENLNNYNLKLSSAFKNAEKADSVKVDSAKVDTAKNEDEDGKTAKSNPDTLDYIFSDFNEEVFSEVFRSQLKNKFNIDSNKQLNAKATQVFYEIKANLSFVDDEPVTAHLILKKDRIFSILKSIDSSHYTNGRLSKVTVWHQVERVTVETQDGAIKNISVHVIDPRVVNTAGQSPRQFLEFKNQYPISISSRNDPERFADVNLYCFNCSGILGLTRYIRLSDLLILDIQLENDKEDYSPSNRVVSLSPSLPIVELKKGKRSRILEIAAYSDFVGLDQEQPNGLIQIEVKRRINLNTKSHAFFKSEDNEDKVAKYDFDKLNKLQFTADNDAKNKDKDSYYIASNEGGNGKETLRLAVSRSVLNAAYYNFLGSIEPRLLFAKLEENNRFLLLNDGNLNDKKINALQVFQHQLVSFGATLNVAKISLPEAKLSWNVIDVGGYWYRSRAKLEADSANTHSTALNTGYYKLGTSVEFHPDNRYGLGFSMNYFGQHTWNKYYVLAHNKGLFQAGFDGYLKTNEEDKFFFRFRWTLEGHNLNSNFTQVQIGYSLNIFSGRNQPGK